MAFFVKYIATYIVKTIVNLLIHLFYIYVNRVKTLMQRYKMYLATVRLDLI